MLAEKIAGIRFVRAALFAVPPGQGQLRKVTATSFDEF